MVSERWFRALRGMDPSALIPAGLVLEMLDQVIQDYDSFDTITVDDTNMTAEVGSKGMMGDVEETEGALREARLQQGDRLSA